MLCGMFSSLYHSQQPTWNNYVILSFNFALQIFRINLRMPPPVVGREFLRFHNVKDVTFSWCLKYQKKRLKLMSKKIGNFSDEFTYMWQWPKRYTLNYYKYRTSRFTYIITRNSNKSRPGICKNNVSKSCF